MGQSLEGRDRHIKDLLLALAAMFGEDGEGLAAGKADYLAEADYKNQRLRTAKAWKRANAIPGKAFGDDTLFANPALEILLDLYIYQQEQRDITVSSACLGARVPPTTALRWIAKMEADGHLERRSDPLDGRRAIVRLTEAAVARMEEALDQAVASDRRLGSRPIKWVHMAGLL